MSRVLQYQSSSQPAPPSEFDYHFEQELGRRLRKRVLWYCGITIVLSLLVHLPGILSGGAPPIQISGAAPAPPIARFLNYGTSALSLLIYIAGFLIVWFRPMRREHVLKLTLWLYVLASIPGLVGVRLIFQLAIPPDLADQVLEQNLRERQRRDAIDAAGLAPPRPREDRPPREGASELGPSSRAATTPTTAPTTTTTRRPGPSAKSRAALSIILQPAMFFSFVVPFLMLVHHTFACLFIPWTLRQSLAPAILLLLVISAIVLIDFFGGGLHWIAAALAIPVTAMMFVPGSMFCWWRFRGLKRDIRLNFDSDRLRSIQAEMNSAKRILESSLPPQRDTGPVRVNYVYEPMRQIGGDLLFMHPATDSGGAVSVVLLDVTGHGVAAALSVNRLIGELERLFAERPDAKPTEVLSTLNRYVYFTMARLDMYVTAIAMRVDPTTRSLEFTSAGHPTAFLRRANGDIVELESTTMLLGIAEDELFAADPIRLTLERGDVLLAYTDGASEARSDQTLQLLGMSGVRQLLCDAAANMNSPSTWPAEMLRRVTEYRMAPPLDDTLLVAVRLGD